METENNNYTEEVNTKLKKDLLIYRSISLVLFALLVISLLYFSTLFNSMKNNTTATVSSTPTTTTSSSVANVPAVTSAQGLNTLLNQLNSTQYSTQIQSGVSQNSTSSSSL